MKNLVFLAAAISLTGCQMIIAPKGIKNISAQGVLDSRMSIYVPVGPDGKYASFPTLEKRDAKASGVAATDVVYRMVGAYQGRIVKGVALETEEQALATARSKGLDYVLYSRVNDWTNTNYFTCSEHLTDSASVDVSVYDVASGKALRIDRLYNAGCPVRVLGIPFGTMSVSVRFADILSVWLNENFRESR